MKRSSYEIKKTILNLIKENSLSYAELERKVNTGFNTIKNSCKELENYGFIEIKKLEKHPSNGKTSYIVSLTKLGNIFLQKENLEKEKTYKV